MKELDLTFVEMVNRNHRAKKYSESIKLRKDWGITADEMGMFAGGLGVFVLLYILTLIG